MPPASPLRSWIFSAAACAASATASAALEASVRCCRGLRGGCFGGSSLPGAVEKRPCDCRAFSPVCYLAPSTLAARLYCFWLTQRIMPYRPLPAATASAAVMLILASASLRICL